MMCLGWNPSEKAAAADDVVVAMREQGMLYVDTVDPEIRPAVILNQPLAVYMSRDLRNLLAVLPVETRVEIVAVEVAYLDEVVRQAKESAEQARGKGVYLVRAETPDRKVEGWVKGEAMPKLNREVIEAAMAIEKRRVEVEAAIAAKQVVEGMTMEEVRLSLGKPDRVSFRRETGEDPKRIDVWVYVIYERVLKTRTVLNPYGIPVIETYYEKEAVGERIVEFVNNAVVAVEEHRDVKRWR
ncbi:MAG: hypothetical protein NZM04_10320 [Methylacidiphilales bacterium]|nr:hypothetical protein [Candidatus Methylacidiphilales bacterium]MDW8349658.1 hypothetical protein [Verrucomicrobiae bacterium]